MSGRIGITPKSWSSSPPPLTVGQVQRAFGDRRSHLPHYGVLHLGKRWYLLAASFDGTTAGPLLIGPFLSRSLAEAEKAHRGLTCS